MGFLDGETAPEAGEALSFSTTLKGREFLVLSLINGLLNIVTLTLYRFWGRTEVRRRVWRGLRVNGEAFEYTGRGVELFIGFLLAVAVLGVPFLSLIFAIQFLGHVWLAVFILPLYIFAFWLFGFGMFTAFRYMASRTTWRGLRFALRGSAQKYGWTWLGMTLLNGVSLGWTQPLMDRMLAEQAWGALRFGDRPFRWSQPRAEAVGLYGPFAVAWFGSIILFLAAAAGFVAFSALLFSLIGPQGGVFDPESLDQDWRAVAATYGYIILVALLFSLLWSPYHAAVLRSIAAGIGLDEARFSLDVRPLSLWWLTCTNYLMLFLSLGLLAPVVQARTAGYLARRLSSTGRAPLNQAHQAPTGPGTGEGLADAFGFSLI